MDPFACKPVHNGRDPKKDDKGGIPCRIEQVGRQPQVSFFGGPGQREVVKEKDNHKKEYECQGIKEQGASFFQITKSCRRRSLPKKAGTQ